MNYLKENKITLILIFVNILFIMTVFKFSYIIPDFSYGYIMLCLLLSLLFYLFTFKLIKKKSLRFIELIVIVILLFIFKDRIISIVYTDINYLNIVNQLMTYSKDIKFFYLKDIFGLYLFIFSFLTLFFLGYGKRNFIIFIDFLCLMLLWITGYKTEVGKSIFLFIFLMVITFAINSYIKNINNLKNKGIKTHIRYSKIWFMIIGISLIISILQMFIPKDFHAKYKNQKEGSYFDDLFYNPDDNVENSKNLRYSIKTSGYNDTEDKLGGPISLDTSLVLKVKAKRPYYLRANVKDKYDGYSWRRSDESYININKEKTKIKINEKYIAGSEKEEIEINPQELKTTTIFSPANSYKVNFKNNRVYYLNDNTFISDDKKGNKYTVDFYKSKDPIDIFNEKNINSFENLNIDIKNDEKSKYEKYLEVPSDVPKDVYKIVYDLTSTAKTDAEKAARIENYLKTNYKYSLDVSQVPSDEEFVSYFLFKEKKGYCTYFATAATIFCRIAGIPARYVEGFYMKDEKEEGEYKVTNDDAHAWSEIMLNPSKENWTIFDCVPLGSENSNDTPLPQNNVSGEEHNLNVHNNTKVNKEKSKSISKVNNKVSNKYEVYYIALLIAVIIMLSIALNNMRRKKKILNSKSSIPLYKYSIKRLKVIGIHMKINETDLEGAARIYDESMKKSMEELIKVCYEEYYGGRIISFNKKDFYKILETYIKKRQKRLPYYFSKVFYK